MKLFVSGFGGKSLILTLLDCSTKRQFLSRLTPTLQYKVCGEYCGPNWCSGDVIDETACVQGGVWGVPSEPGQCADACCRAHDYCCGTAADRPTCNNKLLTCLTSTNCYKSTVCGAAVRP